MACRPYNTGRCLLLRLFNPSKLWGSLHHLSLWHLSLFTLPNLLWILLLLLQLLENKTL